MRLEILLLAHAASTWAMTGLIWLIQLVHYPLFRFADRERFRELSEAHQRRTTWIVGPLMLVEAASASALLFADLEFSWSIRVGWGLLVAIWASTALVQIPLHSQLSIGYDRPTIDRLVRTNWFRTGAWTARAALATVLLG